MQRRLREEAAKLPPRDADLVAAKRQEDNETWELVAIPRIFDATPKIQTHEGKTEKIGMNVLIGYLRNLGQRLEFNDRRKEINFEGRKVSKDEVAKIYGRLASIGLEISKEKAKDSLEMVAAENRFDPEARIDFVEAVAE